MKAQMLSKHGMEWNATEPKQVIYRSRYLTQ